RNIMSYLSVGGWNFRQSGHCHDVAAYRDDEFGACRKPHFTDRYDMMFRSTLPIGIRCKAVLRFGDANGKVAVALVLQFSKAITNLLITDNVVRPVHFTRDGLRFFP